MNVPEASSLILSPVVERALLYVAVAISSFVAFTNWRRGDARAFREPLIAFFALWFVEGALLAAAAAPSLFPASLVQGLDFASVVVVGWAFLASSVPARLSATLLGAGLTFAVALIVFALSATRMAGEEPAWTSTVWSLASLVVAAGATILLILRRSPDRTSGSIAAFAVLALSAALATLLLPDLSRVTQIVAFSLFPVALYQRALGDLRSMHETLREFSQSALKQTQELVTLIEASTYLFTSFDLDELLRRIVEHAALGIDADRAVIILSDETTPHSMRVGSSFPRGTVELGQTFALNTQPALALALSGGDPLQVGPRGHGAWQLAQLLNLNRPGPALVQPLSTQDHAIGAFVAANARGGQEFSEGQMRLMEALGAQIAAAIVNAQLYRGLDTQARELTRVLSARELEVGWYASILESIEDGVLVTNKADHIIVANSVAARLLDTPLEYLRHHPLGNVFERLTPLGATHNIASPEQPDRANTVHAQFAFGERTLHVSMTPMHGLDAERLGVVVVLRDVTAERRAEERRAGFVGSIAQEFRTPVAAIKGYADLLAKGSAGPLPQAANGFVETIRAHAERLSDQVDSIAMFNELDRGPLELDREEADVASMLAEAARAHRPRLEARGIALEVDVAPSLPSVRVDQARFRQVLDQLLDNARKFTPDGGSVRLSAAPSWDGHAVERPAFVAVSVADTGAGFGRDEAVRIFEPFYRGSDPQHVDQVGLGIGLPIARSICEAMGGHVWGRADKGRGATFTCLLPVARVIDARIADAAVEQTTYDSWIDQALSFLEQEKKE